MIEVHSSVEQLGGYFRGLLDDATSATVEEHCAACPACAARLRDEARVELSLLELVESGAAAPSLPVPPRRVRPQRALAWTGAGLVLAAAATFVLVANRHPPVVATAPPAMISKDVPSSSAASSAGVDPVSPTEMQVTLAEGATARLRLPGITAFHVDGSGIVTPLFRGDDVILAGDAAGSERIVFQTEAGVTTVCHVTVTVSGPASPPTPLSVGDVRTLRLGDLESFHVQEAGVVSVLFSGDVVTIEAHRAGRSAVTFVSHTGEVSSYVFDVSAAAPQPPSSQPPR